MSPRGGVHIPCFPHHQACLSYSCCSQGEDQRISFVASLGNQVVYVDLIHVIRNMGFPFLCGWCGYVRTTSKAGRGRPYPNHKAKGTLLVVNRGSTCYSIVVFILLTLTRFVSSCSASVWRQAFTSPAPHPLRQVVVLVTSHQFRCTCLHPLISECSIKATVTEYMSCTYPPQQRGPLQHRRLSCR